jgi:hypothetical protein
MEVRGLVPLFSSSYPFVYVSWAAPVPEISSSLLNIVAHLAEIRNSLDPMKKAAISFKYSSGLTSVATSATLQRSRRVGTLCTGSSCTFQIPTNILHVLEEPVTGVTGNRTVEELSYSHLERPIIPCTRFQRANYSIFPCRNNDRMGARIKSMCACSR